MPEVSPVTAQRRREIAARQTARRRAMQALYGWQMTRDEPKDVLRSFREDDDHAGCDDAFFREILLGVTADPAGMDALMAPVLERRPDELDPTEHAILWVATWELRGHPEIPYRVVINEAVSLARKYGADQSHRFVNAALDRLSRRLRLYEHPEPETAGSA
jgi:N utilization substance protein B